eukprot:g7813.t1 g7813   contig26:339476-340333(-)
MTPQPYIPDISRADSDPTPAQKTRAGGFRTPDGTNFNVYVTGQAPQQQQQLPCYGGFSPMPPIYNFASPPPPPTYPYYGMGMQQQPTVIIMSKEEEKKKSPEKKKETPTPATAAPAPPKEEKKKSTDEMSAVSIASVIIFAIGFIMGIVSVTKTNTAYEVHETWLDEASGSKSGSLFEEWQMARNVALGTGAAAVMCFSVSTLLVFYSGMTHKMKRKAKGGYCLTGFLIAGWIVFAMTFINDIVILVLAFDEDNIIYPEVVWSALIGNIFAWLLMFGYSEMARRA